MHGVPAGLSTSPPVKEEVEEQPYHIICEEHVSGGSDSGLMDNKAIFI